MKRSNIQFKDTESLQLVIPTHVNLITHMRRFTSTVPARGARAPNRAISNSCL